MVLRFLCVKLGLHINAKSTRLRLKTQFYIMYSIGNALRGILMGNNRVF